MFDGVCDLAHCSLRDAAWESNLNPGPDTIVIAASVSSITLSRSCGGTPEDDNDCGDIDFWDSEPDSAVTIIPLSVPHALLTHAWTGIDVERLLHVPPASEGRYPVHLIVEGLYFADGAQLASTGGPFGGGCVAQEGGAHLDILDGQFSGCERDGDAAGTSRGGGAIDSNGPTTIQRTSFYQNSTTFSPGVAMHVTDELWFVDGEVSGNLALAPSCSTCPAHGGGLYVDGLASVYLSTVSNNQAARSGGGVYATGIDAWLSLVRLTDNVAHDGSGGGMALSSEAVELIEVDVGGNTARDDGGGAFIEVPVGSPQRIIRQSSFWENQAGVGSGTGRGGGVALAQRPDGTLDVTIENTTFSENAAGGSASEGGGLAFLGAVGAMSGLELWHTTFHRNEASDGTEVFNGAGAAVSYLASIFWSVGIDACSGPGAFASVGYSSFNDGHHFGVCSGVLFDDAVHPAPLAASTYAGGFTKVNHVLSSDTLRQTFVDPLSCRPVDQHGMSRPSAPPNCTVGALEY